MSTVHIIKPPPTNEARVALYKRLAESNFTKNYSLLEEDQPMDFPYLTVGAAYKGAGGTDPEYGVNVVVQVDAYAYSLAGGSWKVSEMIGAVYSAISEEAITVTSADGTLSYRPAAVLVEDDVINANQFDAATKQLFAQRFVRFRLTFST